MATVITSLATVIPVVGKTIVYWLWGGLFKKAPNCGNTVLKTLLNAGKGFFDLLKKVCYYVINYNCFNYMFQNNIKMFHMTTQSADLSSSSKKSDKSQRLNAEDLMWFVGFVEGDGCFSVNKNGKYFKCEFSIEIHLNDIKLLYKVKQLLGGYGSISTRVKENTSIALLKISSKSDLIRVICPIFDKYPMLTAKQYDYLHFRTCLLLNNPYFDNLPNYSRPNNTPFLNVNDILALDYFDNWLVGFIEAEGCFSVFHATNETNKTCYFSISQKNGLQIMHAIQSRLKLNVNPYYNQVLDIYGLSSSGARGNQNIINFMSLTPTKLKGLKKTNYLKWLREIRINDRYSKINVPNKY